MKAIMMESVFFENKKYKKGEVYDLPREIYNAIYPSAKFLGFKLDTGNQYKVDCSYFDFFSYPLDGYGRLNRFAKDNITFNPNSKTILYIGTPLILGIQNNRDKCKRKVIITMFESDRLPENWVTIINKEASLVLVPSEFCIKVFERSGITVPVKKLPLFFIQHDVKPEYFEGKNTDKFVFGMQNALVNGHQKGDDVLLEAYLKKFKNNKNTLLILKGRQHHYQALDHEFIVYARSFKNVRVMIEDFSDVEIYKEFYCKLDCFVFPSRGEGFGIPPLESMALGIPTITTNGHSIKDYAKLGIPVKTKGKCDSYYVGRGADSINNKWVQINVDDLADKMYKVYKNYNHYKKQAEKNVSEVIRLYDSSVFIKNLQKLIK